MADKAKGRNVHPALRNDRGIPAEQTKYTDEIDKIRAKFLLKEHIRLFPRLSYKKAGFPLFFGT